MELTARLSANHFLSGWILPIDGLFAVNTLQFSGKFLDVLESANLIRRWICISKQRLIRIRLLVDICDRNIPKEIIVELDLNDVKLHGNQEDKNTIRFTKKTSTIWCWASSTVCPWPTDS